MRETSGFGQVRCTHVDSSYKDWACKYFQMLLFHLLVLDFYIIYKLLCCIYFLIIMCVVKCLSASVHVN